MQAKAVPEGASPVIPRLVCRDAAAEIEFCRGVFGAELGVSRSAPDGKVGHAMMLFNGAMLMIEAEWPALPSRAPAADGSSPVVIYVYVADVDRVVDLARARGARVLYEPQDQFWGDRVAWLQDPEGHVWTVASRVENTTENQRRERWAAELAGNRGAQAKPR